MAKGKVTYKSYRKEVDARMKKANNSGLILMGEFFISAIVLAMTRLGIVDTGRLRASMSYVVGKVTSFGKLHHSKDKIERSDKPVGEAEQNKLVIGSNVNYSYYQEKLRPHIKPSVLNNIEQARKLFNEAYEKEMK